MFLWFAACAVLGAWSVLRDANFDYRLIALGALAPDVIDASVGHRALAHTLAFAVGALVAVMLATISRRPLRKHLLALPIGLLAHLVLDAVWVDKTLFWWPGFGDWGATRLLPAAPLVALRELAGVVVAVVVVRRFGLADPALRRQFWRTGRLTPC
ncbi:MAG TPA: metal-dependent hydrolase [Acidimicrobiales bacterium]|nr:metal-dependent hydrolase [Acidimicrobiales bacterium]